jgi:hypothetical protein
MAAMDRRATKKEFLNKFGQQNITDPTIHTY